MIRRQNDEVRPILVNNEGGVAEETRNNFLASTNEGREVASGRDSVRPSSSSASTLNKDNINSKLKNENTLLPNAFTYTSQLDQTIL